MGGIHAVVVFCEEYARGSFVVQALTAAGFNVRWVQNGDTALRLAEREDVDALIADARSEEVVGPLVLAWRRRRPAGPVVLMTRPGDTASATLADDVLSSPLTVEGITRVLQRALGERLSA